MNAKVKRNSVVTSELLESGMIRFTVRDAGTFDFNPSKAHESLRDRAEVHGWIQRISDAAAMSRDEATGKPASPADKLARMVALKEHYESGTEQWARSGGAGTGQSIVILAVQRVMGLAEYKMAEEHMARYGAAHPEIKDVKAFYAAMPKVQSAILDIQRERLATPILDADAETDALKSE